MRNGHVILSSALSPYLYLCFLICGYSNYINKPKINSADSEEAFNLYFFAIFLDYFKAFFYLF